MPLRIKENIRILTLHGSEEEMAYQHGQLLKDEIPLGAVPYLARKIEHELETDGPLKDKPWIRKLVIGYLSHSVFRPLIRQIPNEYIKILNALASGSNIGQHQILKACTLPDAMVILSYKGLGKYFAKHLAPDLFGCTSFVAYNDMTATGELIHGRNLDFPVLDTWDKYPCVIYHHPDKGQRYVCLTTSGVHVPGVTGYNESGLIMGIHQLFTTDSSSHGVPIVILTSEIIKKARSIDDAIRIAKKMKSAGNWGIVISSFKEKRAVVIEAGPKMVYVREAEASLIAYSNYCFCAHLKKHEIFFNQTTAQDNVFRYRRLMHLCAEQKHKLTAEEGVSILGDHFDEVTRRKKSIGRTVSAIYNVQSVLFEPEKMRFFVTTGKAPSNLTPYLELPWQSEDLKDDIHLVKPNDYAKTDQAAAMRSYARAYHHFSNTKDFLRASVHIKEAMKLDPEEFAYPFALGFMHIKLGSFDAALKDYHSSQGLCCTEQEKALVSLMIGRTYDLLGNRGQAKKSYAPYEKNIKIDLKLRHAFQRSMRRGYRRKDVEKSVFQFIFSDFLAY